MGANLFVVLYLYWVEQLVDLLNQLNDENEHKHS